MADIFISYSNKDVEYTRALVDLLSGRGLDLFWDHHLLPGPKYREILAQELDRAKCVIVLWSEASVKSEWVADEAEEGKKGDRLVSILIDNLLPPLGFRQGQAAKLWDWDGKSENKETDVLLAGIAAVIAKNTTVKTPFQNPALQDEEPSHLARDTSLDEDRNRRHSESRAQSLPVTSSGTFHARHPAFMPSLLLLIVFTVNYLQTAWDAATTLDMLGSVGGYPFADAFSWFEAYLSFGSHDVSNPIAYKGYSISYFFLFPLIAIAVTLALAFKESPRPYRTFSLAVMIDYLMSLPFFIFLPIPERWAYPDSNAILLSDLWNESLITYIRPISGLDNCFPSFHTSLTVILITVCYLYNVRLKTSFLFIGATIILATFVLGIHWIPDIISGIFVGLLSVILAHRLEKSGKADFLWV